MLEMEDVVHDYGTVQALDGVSFSADRGEFLTILGESGCGKTTVLRVISGLETPKKVARLVIDGESVIGVRPAQRRCTTVFQNYALFPHMSVIENVGYGLKVRGISRPDVREAALSALAMVQLDAKAERRISQLSGGERQRVALARAVITKPSILLLDEPLGALDEKLRIAMQSELVSIQRTLGMTFIYITHSQEEALTMSDRIILMRKGRIEQVGKPVDLFDRPINRFAAEFMGFENILEGSVSNQSAGGEVRIRLPDGSEIAGMPPTSARFSPGQPVHVAVRADRIRFGLQKNRKGSKANWLGCRSFEQLYRGKYIDQFAETTAGRMKLRQWDRAASPQDADAVTWQVDDSVVLSA